jgi:NitT/TauT family transport system permease protein
MTLILGALIFWVSAWILNAKLADSTLAETRAIKLLVPIIF